jgi:predicted PurR-regulated permease PerM
MTVFLSLFLLCGIAVLIAILKLVRNIKQVVERADEVIDSVESAAEVFKDTKGNLALLKVIGNILKLANKKFK